MPRIESLLHKLKELVFNKLFEFIFQKIKIFFVFLMFSLIFFILFQHSIYNLYQTRKQVENYEQSSLAFKSFRIVELPISDLRMPVKHSPIISSSELYNKLINFIDKAKIVDKDLHILQTKTKSFLDNLITYILSILKILEVVGHGHDASEAYNQTKTFMENELKRMMLVGQYAIRR
ncbi:hypothetical protein C1645_761328 [Glomus cerebriforme]|uniref:Uncharacterized protein n=1 Tax=Glomus cerebriforme TaxID=658196 RepID=A0A397T6H2_9GLOM|nr:hypothetical protein C1645_761328 [Glomus cerebriforme]